VKLNEYPIQLSHDLSFPLDVVTQALAILAKRRAGKSYLARRLSEQILKAAQQITIVDPKGDWWGIRSAADGKRPGFPVVILGGERGDVKLEPSAGEVVAKLIVEERVNALLDLSLLRKHEVATFMAIFLETLYRLKAREQYRTPLMLLIDEADAIAPQKPQKGEERMLGAAEDIVRRGGQRGIGCTLITQRSAVLNKNVLTQVQILIALRTIAPQDLAAMDAWIDVHGTPEQRKALMESLPSLPVGTAWVWSPGWPTTDGIFERIKVQRITTFDSGATPKPGEKRIEPRNLADVDLDALQRQMAETIEKAKADDPRLLRKRIAELEKQRAVAPPPPRVPEIDNARLEAAKRDAWGLGYATALEVCGAAIGRATNTVTETLKEVLGRIERMPYTPPLTITTRADSGWKSPATITMPEAVRIAKGIREKAEARRDGGEMGSGERSVLIACAQYPEGVTRDQLSILTGFKTSTRNAYIQRLQARGYVMAAAVCVATSAGVAALGPTFKPLPTGDALRAWWMNLLPEGERRIFELVCSSYPNSPSRDYISEVTGFKVSTRNAYIQRLRARKIIEIDGERVKASRGVFD
jgi:hypothetical protein